MEVDILQAVSSVGFPIAMCIYLMFYMQKQTEAHAEEMKTVTEAINNNTIAITKLSDEIKSKER